MIIPLLERDGWNTDLAVNEYFGEDINGPTQVPNPSGTPAYPRSVKSEVIDLTAVADSDPDPAQTFGFDFIGARAREQASSAGPAYPASVVATVNASPVPTSSTISTTHVTPLKSETVNVEEVQENPIIPRVYSNSSWVMARLKRHNPVTRTRRFSTTLYGKALVDAIEVLPA